MRADFVPDCLCRNGQAEKRVGPRSVGSHYNTFVALEVADPAFSALSGYFDGCRLQLLLVVIFIMKPSAAIASTPATAARCGLWGCNPSAQ